MIGDVAIVAPTLPIPSLLEDQVECRRKSPVCIGGEPTQPVGLALIAFRRRTPAGTLNAEPFGQRHQAFRAVIEPLACLVLFEAHGRLANENRDVVSIEPQIIDVFPKNPLSFDREIRIIVRGARALAE